MEESLRGALQQAIVDNDLAKVRQLARHPAIDLNLHNTDSAGDPLLLSAALSQTPEILACLLDAGAEIDIQNPLGLTALTLACGATGELKHSAAMLLLSRGADVNLVVSNGFTPLMYAAQQGAPSVVRALLQRGAQVNVCSEEVSQLTPLLLAAAGGHEEVALMLLTAGADPQVQTDIGFTPFIYAGQQGLLSFTKALLQKTDPEDAARQLNLANHKGWTALHMAAHKGHLDVAELFLMHGADPNAQDAEGRAPLISAIVTRNLHGILQLLRYGADPNLRGPAPGPELPFVTPVTIALMSKSEDAVKLLIAYGGELRLAMGNEPERSIFQKDEREYLLSNQADRVELLSRRLPEHLGFAAENLDKIIMPGVERCQAMKQAGKWQPLSDVKSSLHSAYQELLSAMDATDEVLDFYLALVY